MSGPKLLLARTEVEEMVGLSATTIYRLMREGRFPEPVRINGTSAVRWKATEVTSWAAAQTERATGDLAQ